MGSPGKNERNRGRKVPPCPSGASRATAFLTIAYFIRPFTRRISLISAIPRSTGAFKDLCQAKKPRKSKAIPPSLDTQSLQPLRDGEDRQRRVMGQRHHSPTLHQKKDGHQLGAPAVAKAAPHCLRGRRQQGAVLASSSAWLRSATQLSLPMPAARLHSQGPPPPTK
jgi:hypothetical protein